MCNSDGGNGGGWGVMTVLACSTFCNCLGKGAEHGALRLFQARKQHLVARGMRMVIIGSSLTWRLPSSDANVSIRPNSSKIMPLRRNTGPCPCINLSIYLSFFLSIPPYLHTHKHIFPVVPHKAVAEVSIQETYRKGWLL